MTAKNHKAKQSFRFKRWSRKGYAVFQSLGKIVHIGVVLMTYNLLTKPVVAQERIESPEYDTEADTLPEVEILTSEPSVVMSLSGVPQQSIRLTESAIQDASELAQDLAGTDIRQRGIHGVQGDVSIRGGSPEQVGILLNGIPLNDVQTGHHNLNLPIPAISLTQIQRFTPGTSQQAGSGIYSGALNYQNLLSETNRLKIWLGGGQYSYFDLSLGADFQTGKARHHLATSWKSSEGHSDNTDFESAKVYYHSLIPISDKLEADLQSGYLNKSFGAESFYTSKYPKQFEAISTWFGSLKLQSKGAIKISPSFSYRRHKDRFELFREDLYPYINGYYIMSGNDTAKYVPGIYEAWNYYSGHNYHMSEVYNYQTDFRNSNTLGDFHLGIQHKHESILSNVLGKELNNPIPIADQTNATYSYKAIRDQVNLLASYQSVEVHNFHLGLSGMLHYTETYGFHKYGSVRLHYKPNEHFSTWIAYNQSMRLPSFTDLYYSGASNYGNPNLIPEEAGNTELGFFFRKQSFTGRTQFFYQRGKNMIDWVKSLEDSKYTSMNHTNLDTYGVEFSISWHPSEQQVIKQFIHGVEFNYTGMHKDKFADDLISAYALDYLKHQAFLKTTHQVGTTGIGADLTFRYQDRNGSFTSSTGEIDYPDFLLMDISLSYQWKSHSVFIQCVNLFDTKVEDFGNIKLPGRWLKLGLKLDFQQNKRK